MRVALALASCAACGPGNSPVDYPPPPLHDLGLHDAPIYTVTHLMPTRGIAVMLAHPRLTQPAIRQVGETLDVGWLAADPAARAATITIDGAAVTADPPVCDDVGVCHAALAVPALAPGRHELCVEAPVGHDCAAGALAVVERYADPPTIVQFSDAHVGDGSSLAVLGPVIDAISTAHPDFVVFTGDAADTGLIDQRSAFLGQLARLEVPVFEITGNHDYDHGGIDGYLIDVGPELDFEARYGAVALIGLSSGQDLDDGNHDTTISESSGPDPGQLDWLAGALDDATPTIVMLHHPIYNGLFATVGPDARDRLRDLVTRDNVRAVLAGHTHISAVFDADGNSRGLSTDAESDVDRARWPLHYIAARATRGDGGFAVLHLGSSHVDYAWRDLR